MPKKGFIFANCFEKLLVVHQSLIHLMWNMIYMIRLLYHWFIFAFSTFLLYSVYLKKELHIIVHKNLANWVEFMIQSHGSIYDFSICPSHMVSLEIGFSHSLMKAFHMWLHYAFILIPLLLTLIKFTNPWKGKSWPKAQMHLESNVHCFPSSH